MKEAKSNKSDAHKKRGGKTYIKHELGVLIEMKLKKVLIGKKKSCKQKLSTLIRWIFPNLKIPCSP